MNALCLFSGEASTATAGEDTQFMPPAVPQPDPQCMAEAIRLATENVTSGRGGPFGAVIVREGKILARGVNQVTANNDPTAHAEVMAIRSACAALGTFKLTGSSIYTSCEPCPMCLAAIYWAHMDAIYYGNTAADAARIGFGDQFLYEELAKPLPERSVPIHRLLGEQAAESFQVWQNSPFKVEY